MKPINNQKVNVSFSLQAITKIMYLVMHETAEVGWRMICKRAVDWDDNNMGYYIEDILVYPQEVGPATVDTDEKALGEWENNLDDNTFNNMRGQGHSHVSMGVTPSGTDIDHQMKILKQLGDDDFYIFIIVNKNFKFHFDIYDTREGFHYENDDVTYDFIGWKQPDLSLIKKSKPSYVFGSGHPKTTKPPYIPTPWQTDNKTLPPVVGDYPPGPQITCKDEVLDPTGSDLYDMFMRDDEMHSTIWDDIGGV